MATVKMKGIDVSYWQGKPLGSRYKKYKDAGWDFIIARIGYADGGVKAPDSTFDHNYKMAVKYGIKIGAYFYSNAKNGVYGRRLCIDQLVYIKNRRFRRSEKMGGPVQ